MKSKILKKANGSKRYVVSLTIETFDSAEKIKEVISVVSNLLGKMENIVVEEATASERRK